MENTDDEALSWAGDESRMRGSGTWSVPKRAGGGSPSSSPDSLIETDSLIEPVEICSSSAGEAGVSRRDSGFDTSTPSTTQPASGWQDSAALLATGVLAGVYLLFTAAWVITALRNPIAIADPLGSIMFTLGLWLAAFAGPLTFAAIVVWRRGRGVALRLVWLALGALALIPWPYVSWVG
jgi:hypothetical protein